jgi:hypothetical protein
MPSKILKEPKELNKRRYSDQQVAWNPHPRRPSGIEPRHTWRHFKEQMISAWQVVAEDGICNK